MTPTAATAERSRTSADASFSRLSPSSTVTIRDETPALRTIAVATASVGLMIAPSAMASGSPMPGSSWLTSSPTAIAEPKTSTTDSPEMIRKSRRNSIVGMLTAAEYSKGGSTPPRITSDGISTVPVTRR